MGCDIHLHIEVKIDDKWEHYAAPKVERFYKLFEKMAGVRGDLQNAISKPKGLPFDLNRITALDYRNWEPDAHSMSWLDIEEIEQLVAWLNINYPGLEYDLEHSILSCYFFSNSFISLPEDIPEVTDVRFVFWFDN